MNKKRIVVFALIVGMSTLIFAGCNNTGETNSSGDPGSSEGTWPPKTTSTTLEDYKRDFEHEAIEGGHEFVHADELGSYYNATSENPVYNYIYRPYSLDNGIMRLLSYKYAYVAKDDSEYRVDVICEVADFYEDRLIETVAVDAASLVEYEVRGTVYQEPAIAYGWLDQNHIYLSSRSKLGIVNLLTSGISIPTADPAPIYEAAGSHNSSYLALVADPRPMEGKLYYFSNRNPETLNITGDIYEADINGERLILKDATGVEDVADGAIAYMRLNATDPVTEGPMPDVHALYCYDVESGTDSLVFGDTYLELDDNAMIVGGVVVGNQWADKQETYNNPPFIIEGRQLFFYVSRIGERKVDRYVYDIATGNLLLQETTSADDYA